MGLRQWISPFAQKLLVVFWLGRLPFAVLVAVVVGGVVFRSWVLSGSAVRLPEHVPKDPRRKTEWKSGGKPKTEPKSSK